MKTIFPQKRSRPPRSSFSCRLYQLVFSIMLNLGRKHVINQEGVSMKLDTVFISFSLSICIYSSVLRGRSKDKASNLGSIQRSSIHVRTHVGTQAPAHTNIHGDRNVNLQPFLVSIYFKQQYGNAPQNAPFSCCNAFETIKCILIVFLIGGTRDYRYDFITVVLS